MGGEPFALGMAPITGYSSTSQKIEPPSLSAGLARWLEDSLAACGKRLDLTHEDLARGIKGYLDENFTSIEKDAAYGRKQIEKERMSRPYSRFEEAVRQVKRDVERMKNELDLGLEGVLEFRDKIPKESGE